MQTVICSSGNYWILSVSYINIFFPLIGQCEPITLELCMNLPYNYTNYPNYLGHRTQKEASISWESSLFPALVQTNCYKYLMFFACTILVPKCDPQTNQRIPPCRYHLVACYIKNKTQNFLSIELYFCYSAKWYNDLIGVV